MRFWSLFLAAFAAVLIQGCGPQTETVGKRTQKSSSDATVRAEIGEEISSDEVDETVVEELPTPTPEPTPTPSPPEPSDDMSLEDGLKLIDGVELEANLRELASDKYLGRGSGDDENELAADFIIEKFEEAGCEPGNRGEYLQRFSASRGKGYTHNVVCIFEGTDPVLKDEVIVVGGHYDHLGYRGSSVYNGADDNTSGTVAVMETARILGKMKDNLKRTVVVVTFSGEEIGLIGSNYYVRNPVKPISDTVFMVNLDMIGRLRNKNLSFLGGATTSTGSSLMRAISSKYSTINPSITSSSGGGSDHVPFKNKGVPSVFLHTGSHSDYHRTSDTADKINYEGLRDITKITLELVWSLAQLDAKPRVLVMERVSEDDLKFDHGGGVFDVFD